jgi:sulfur-oxidizing protein SoxY
LHTNTDFLLSISFDATNKDAVFGAERAPYRKDGVVERRIIKIWTRRGVIAAAGLAILATGARLRLRAQQSAAGVPSNLDAIRALVGDRPLLDGRVHLDLAEAVENNRSVPLAIRVDSPMSEADHVTTVHVLSPGAADPLIASYRFTADCGRAFVEFHARLTDGAPLVVLAVMSDGNVYKAERIVAVAASGVGG